MIDAVEPAPRQRASGGLSVREAIDAFLDTAAIKTNPNTLRAYAGVLDRVAELIGPSRALAELDGDELGDVLTTLWGRPWRNNGTRSPGNASDHASLAGLVVPMCPGRVRAVRRRFWSAGMWA
jgi:hypothetical protein